MNSVAIQSMILWSVTEFQNRYIECTAAEVVYGHLHIVLLLVHTVGQRGCGRLVDDTLNLQARDLTGFFRGLSLRVAEVSGS